MIKHRAQLDYHTDLHFKHNKSLLYLIICGLIFVSCLADWLFLCSVTHPISNMLYFNHTIAVLKSPDGSVSCMILPYKTRKKSNSLLAYYYTVLKFEKHGISQHAHCFKLDMASYFCSVCFSMARRNRYLNSILGIWFR